MTNNRPIAAADHGLRAETGFTLAGTWALVRRNLWLVLATWVAVLGGAAAYTWLSRPLYQSEATIRIDQDKGAENLLTQVGPIPGLGDKGAIETEMIVLRSRTLSEQVVDSLALGVRLASPRLPRSTFFSGVHAARTAAAATYELERRPDGSYTVKSRKGGPAGPLPVVVPGREATLGGVRLTLRSGAPPAERLELEVLPFRDAVARMQKALSVTKPSFDADVVAVGYKSTDPELAAAVPNGVSNAFIAFKARSSKTESTSTVDFLREQVANYEGQLASAESRLKTYREQAQVVSIQDQASEEVKRLAELQARRDEVQSENQALSALLDRAQSEAGTRTGSASYRQLAAFPAFLSNKAVQDILQTLTDLEGRRSDLLVMRTAENPDVQVLDRRISDLETQLYRTARSYQESLGNQLRSLNDNLSRFGAQLATIPAREVEYARLLRQQKLLEEIYTLLQTRLKEAEIREAVQPGNIRVIDAALVPERPVSPRPGMNLSLAFVLGLLLAVAGAFARETLDTKVRTREQAQAAGGGIPILAAIPRIRPRAAPAMAAANGNGNGNGKHAAVGANGNGASATAGFTERLVTSRDPSSPASEAYRALRTSVIFANVDGPPQCLVVTSALPGDGKSTSAANLAITMAQQGSRTLLVDADLRLGTLNEVFGVPRQPGLTEVLLMGVPVEEAVREIHLGGSGVPLHLLPSGVFPPNPAEVVGSERMRQLIDRLRTMYDAVIFDAPPINMVTDAALLGKLADTTLLVTRAGTTPRPALHHAAIQLQNLRVPVSGIVLNDLELKGAAYGYGYGGYAAGTN